MSIMIEVFFIFKVICLFTAIIITFANQNPVYAVLHLVTFFVTGSFLLLFIGVDFLPYVFIIVYAGAVAVLFLFIVIILKIKLGSTQINYRNIFLMLFSSLFLSLFTYSLTFINPEIYHGKITNPDQENQLKNPLYLVDRFLLLYYRLPRITPKSKTILKDFRIENGKTMITSTFTDINLFGRRVRYAVDIPLKEGHYTYFLASLYRNDKELRELLPYPCKPGKFFLSNENYFIYDKQSSLTNLGKILYTEYNIHFIICGLILLVAIIGAISLTRGYNTSISLKQKIFIQTTRSSMIGKITL
jgi:NADH:ubiquinone oxidoreductase subunit 6 (subunit J)